MTNKIMNILLVEDDDVSSEAVLRCFKKNGLEFPVYLAQDGIEALEILRGENGKTQIQIPFIILLDLNMPRMSGFEFLEVVREDPELCDSVVFILTTSDADSDRSRAYNENIAGYMVKSAVGPQFSHLVRLLDSYNTAVTLPKIPS